jgi:nitrite reductase (NADH) large subunit
LTSSARALGRYSIAVIGAEGRLAYNRVLLSPLLAGEIAEPDIELKPAAWWRARGVSTIYGRSRLPASTARPGRSRWRTA